MSSLILHLKVLFEVIVSFSLKFNDLITGAIESIFKAYSPNERVLVSMYPSFAMVPPKDDTLPLLSK